MLTQLIALGLFSATPSGSTETGEVIASLERTVLFPVRPVAAGLVGMPFGAEAYDQPYDPADHAPYASDFSELLDDGEIIASINAVTLNATAALLSVAVDQSAGYRPIIDEADGKKVQLWFVVDEAAWAAASFGANGVVLPVTVRITTDATPPKRYERTGLLTVRQL